jgi:peptide/nickel transport system substrate-binding protein
MSSNPRGQRRLRGAIAASAAAIATCAMFASPAMADDSSASPSAPAPSASAHSRTTFVIGLKQDIDTLNPYVGVLASSFDAYQLMYDYLTTISASDMTIKPSLATSWETSPDGLTWTFHLRQGVKWSDGQDLTADDVVWSYSRVLQSGTTENGQYGTSLPEGTTVKATDPYTVVFHTPKPSAVLLSTTSSQSVPIVPKHIWQSIPESKVGTYKNDGSDGKPVVGSGPFTLKAAKKGQYYEFTANQTYWGGAPHIAELDMRVYQNDDTLVQALESGEVDFAQDLSAKAFNGLKNKNEPDITLNKGASTYVYEMGFNNGAATVDNKKIGDGSAALTNVQVRQAIDYAIDKQTIVDKVLLGAGKPAFGEMSPLYAQWYWEPTGDEKRTYNPDKAKQLLDAAGYPMGPNGYRVGPDGKELDLRLFARSENSDSQDEAQYIQAWLKAVGIKVNVQVMSEDALTTVIGEGKYDMFQWDWSFGPDPDSTLSVFTCANRSTMDNGAISAGWSDSFYCNPQFESLDKQEQETVDPAARKPIIKQALQNLYDNAMYSTLYYGTTLEAYRNDRFTGFVPQPGTGGALVSQIGTWSYMAMKPYDPNAAKAAGATSGAKGSSNTAMILGIAGVVVLLLIVGGFLIAARRRSTADERE